MQQCAAQEIAVHREGFKKFLALLSNLVRSHARK
jgi:hypothetical protein